MHPLYKHIFVPAVAPSLALIGLLWKSLRNPQFELQVLSDPCASCPTCLRGQPASPCCPGVCQSFSRG